MTTRNDLHEQLTRRTHLAGSAGLEIVPVGVLLFVFGLGELGWPLGSWFMPTLGTAAIAAAFGSVAAVHWRRRRYGQVKLRWDHRVTALVVTIGAAHMALSMTDAALTGPLYPTGLTLGLLLAAISLWSPHALAQHLVFGLLIAVTSAIPLGFWINVPIPPIRADELGAQTHPLALLQPLIVPSWLIVTGIVGHLRLSRAFARPAIDDTDAAGPDAG